MSERGPQERPGERKKNSAEVKRHERTARRLRKLYKGARESGEPIPHVDEEELLNEAAYFDRALARLENAYMEDLIRDGHVEAAMWELRAGRKRWAGVRQDAAELARIRQAKLARREEEWRAEAQIRLRDAVVTLTQALIHAIPHERHAILAVCRRELPELVGATPRLPGVVDAEVVEERVAEAG